jgi:hypothetical protein
LKCWSLGGSDQRAIDRIMEILSTIESKKSGLNESMQTYMLVLNALGYLRHPDGVTIAEQLASHVEDQSRITNATST